MTQSGLQTKFIEAPKFARFNVKYQPHGTRDTFVSRVIGFADTGYVTVAIDGRPHAGDDDPYLVIPSEVIP